MQSVQWPPVLQVRLAQAHARLMCRETVELMDAIASLTIVESSMQVGLF